MLLLLVLISNLMSAQENTKSEGSESITISELRDHIYYLSSDELEGRLPGTAGYDKAAQYAVTQFRQAGLSPVCRSSDSKLTYYQNVPIHKFYLGPNTWITITKDKNEHTFSLYKDFFINIREPLKGKVLSGELVVVGSGIKEPDYEIDDYKGIDVKGKWVMMLYELPVFVREKLPEEILKKYFPDFGYRIQLAKDAGALGIITIILDDNEFEIWKEYAQRSHEFYTLPEIGNLNYNKLLTLIVVDSLVIDYLFEGQINSPHDRDEYSKSYILPECKVQLKTDDSLSILKTTNAIGLIEGSDSSLKHEYIVLCGHLDHLGSENSEVMNGADDNASGSAGILEIAEAIAKSKPERSVICLLTTGEEIGRQGSYYFTENSPVPLKDIIANINIDMIGWSNTDVNGLAPIGSESVTPKLKETINRISEKTPYVKINWAYADTCPIFDLYDQYPFHLKGIPAVTFFSGSNADYHTPKDDAEKIDFEFYQKSCRFIYEVVLELANGDINLRE
jgi:hypothetical protein